MGTVTVPAAASATNSRLDRSLISRRT
jgi:hypothetical protein